MGADSISNERAERETSGGRHTGSQPSLSSPLRRLLADPRRLNPVSLWHALSAEARAAAVRAYLGTDKGGRKRLNEIVAEARNFRPATVQKWPAKKITAAMRFVPLRDPRLASRLLQRHHVPGQVKMVTDFLDALGVPHNEGLVDSFAEVDADEDVVRLAVGSLAKKNEPSAAAAYLLTLRVLGAPVGEKGRLLLRELLEPLPDRDDPESEESPSAEREPPQPDAVQARDEEEDPTRQVSFTTLDRLLIFAAVDSAQGIEGALTADELDDLVDELVTLNGRRHHSYFHAGFRDVLFDKPVAKELPAANRSRLQWYWTGAVQGWARRERWDRIVREHATNPVVKELGSGLSTASLAAVRHIMEALRREGHTAKIARFVKVPALVGQPPLFRLLLDAATELLGQGDAASALPLFELLVDTRTELEQRGVPPTERLLLDAHRRMAHCLRHLHQHDRAQGMLRDLLEHDPDPNIHAMVHADLGLIVGGFDGLEEVVLPLRRDERHGVVERLASGVEHFRKSVDIGAAYSAHGHYCLGVLALGRAVADHSFEDAEHHLQRTRTHFSKAADSYRGSLIDHASLYFGIAKAQQLSSNKLAQAADVMTESMASGARMPTYLIEQTIVALGLAEEKRDLRRVTEAIIESGGDPALDELANCHPALDHCPSLADKLAKRAKAEGRAAVNRAADLRAALRGFLSRGNANAAGETLDGLERLARDDVAIPEFIELLKDRTRYDPAWDLEDATIARARCCEDRGDFIEATTVLRDLFFRLASPERKTGLSDAAGVLDRVRGYGIDRDSYSAMTSRYNALASREADEAEPVEPDVTAPVRILVVGGAELQARAEAAVWGRLEEQHPHIRARFIRTGWSGNWSRTFSEIEREMKRHDALVILRFMRTHLGREIRRTWNGPWRSCWGGPGAIVEAVVEVAEAVERTR